MRFISCGCVKLKRYTRSRAQIVASLGQPLLYLLVLGFGLGPVFQKAGNGSYLQFVAPGVIGMSVLFTSVFSGIAYVVRPAIWISEGNAGRSSAAVMDHDWKDAGRCDGGDATGAADSSYLPDRRVSAGESGHDSRWESCSWRLSPSFSQRWGRRLALVCRICRDFSSS